MRNVSDAIDRLWRIGGSERATRLGGSGRGPGIGRASRCLHSGSGGAASARSGEAGMMGTRQTAQRGRRQAASSGAAQKPMYAPVPIWLAALSASRCLAVSDGQDHAVSWDCVSGRAVYTNAGENTETIQPLGISLQGGETLAVSWLPGETAYTIEVYGQN